MQTIRYQRRPEVLQQTGLSNSTLYKRINDGLFVPPINLGGARAVGWLQHEVNYVLVAMAEGKPESEIRKLVQNLIQARKDLIKGGSV
jgi:prophage regulatory protein